MRRAHLSLGNSPAVVCPPRRINSIATMSGGGHALQQEIGDVSIKCLTREWGDRKGYLPPPLPGVEGGLRSHPTISCVLYAHKPFLVIPPRYEWSHTSKSPTMFAVDAAVTCQIQEETAKYPSRILEDKFRITPGLPSNPSSKLISMPDRTTDFRTFLKIACTVHTQRREHHHQPHPGCRHRVGQTLCNNRTALPHRNCMLNLSVATCTPPATPWALPSC